MSARRRRAAVGGLEAFVGADVEARLVCGAVHRGQLIGASGEWLELESHSGRRVLVRVAAVAAVVDETAAPPQSAGRTHRRGANDA